MNKDNVANRKPIYGTLQGNHFCLYFEPIPNGQNITLSGSNMNGTIQRYKNKYGNFDVFDISNVPCSIFSKSVNECFNIEPLLSVPYKDYKRNMLNNGAVLI